MSKSRANQFQLIAFLHAIQGTQSISRHPLEAEPAHAEDGVRFQEASRFFTGLLILATAAEIDQYLPSQAEVADVMPPGKRMVGRYQIVNAARLERMLRSNADESELLGGYAPIKMVAEAVQCLRSGSAHLVLRLEVRDGLPLDLFQLALVSMKRDINKCIIAVGGCSINGSPRALEVDLLQHIADGAVQIRASSPHPSMPNIETPFTLEFRIYPHTPAQAAYDISLTTVLLFAATSSSMGSGDLFEDL